MSSKPRGVICSGNLVYDTLVSPVEELHWGATTFVDCIECHAGGNGANTSRALAAVGVPVRLLGGVGHDQQGCFVLQVLERAGVSSSHVERVNARTSASIAIVKPSGERKFFHQMGASREAFAEPIRFTRDLCDGMAHYHMASMFVLPRLRARGPEPLIDARAAGLTTSFDTNWDPEGGWMQTLAPCLRHLDWLFMNEDEARMIAGSTNPTQIARAVLGSGLGALALKLGCGGCAIYTDEREVLCPAFDVLVKDTTGAGDCFVAGFLAAVLDGASLADAGRFANAVGALTIQQIGAATGLVPKNEVKRWMASAPVRGQSGS